MYFETRIDIPDVPGKITISRKIYVQYEIGRRYNPEKKYNIPIRVTIGKLCADETGKMFPTENSVMLSIMLIRRWNWRLRQ